MGCTVFASMTVVHALTSRAGSFSLMEGSSAFLPPALSSRAHMTLSALK